MVWASVAAGGLDGASDGERNRTMVVHVHANRKEKKKTRDCYYERLAHEGERHRLRLRRPLIRIAADNFHMSVAFHFPRVKFQMQEEEGDEEESSASSSAAAAAEPQQRKRGRPRTRPGPAADGSRAVVYTRFTDMTADKTYYNTYGVLEHFSEPRSTRGTDVILRFSLRDPLEPNKVLKLAMFCARAEHAPPFRQKGDIVRIHHFKVASG